MVVLIFIYGTYTKHSQELGNKNNIFVFTTVAIYVSDVSSAFNLLVF
jgi:hypothetical protein